MRRLAGPALALSLVLAGCADKKSSSPTKSEPVAEPTEAKHTVPLAAGAKAPLIDSVAHDGTRISIADLRGKPIVVFFYPKDETPG